MTNLNFIFLERSKSGLTSVWEVRSAHTDVLLGYISWYASWRRYTLQAVNSTIYDSVCLKEISEFLDEQMELRKQTGDL